MRLGGMLDSQRLSFLLELGLLLLLLLLVIASVVRHRDVVCPTRGVHPADRTYQKQKFLERLRSF